MQRFYRFVFYLMHGSSSREVFLLLWSKLCPVVDIDNAPILRVNDHLFFAVYLLELSCHWNEVCLVREESRAFVDTSMGRVAVRQLNNLHRTVQVQENIVGRVGSRITWVDNGVCLVCPGEAVGCIMTRLPRVSL